MLNKSLILSCLFFLVSLNTYVQANNNRFLPGDCFFPTTLDQSSIKTLVASDVKDARFTYSRIGGYTPAFCGNFGYQHAKFENLDQKFIENLNEAYSRYRKQCPIEWKKQLSADGTKEVKVEGNPMRVLFYQDSFEFPKHSLFLRYNENWVDDLAAFGHGKDFPSRLCCLIEKPEAIVESWRLSKSIPALKSKLPELNPENRRKPQGPALIQGKIKAYILLEGSLVDYYRPYKSKTEGLKLLVVDSAGIKELTFHRKGGWKEEKPEK